MKDKVVVWRLKNLEALPPEDSDEQNNVSETEELT